MLAVDIAEMRRQILQQRDRSGAIVDVYAALAVRLDLAIEQQFLSCVNPAPSSTFAAFAPSSNTPETRALSLPERIMSIEARPPSSRPSASTTIDLPLPSPRSADSDPL